MTFRIPRAVLVVAGMLILAAAFGAGGYVFGYKAADRAGMLAKGRAAGRLDGIAEGRHVGYTQGQDDTAALYAKGTQNYERIYKRGYRAGKLAGLTSGYTAGNTDAFAGFDSGWEVGGWYIVHFGQPTGGARYNIDKRVPMDSGQTYNICPHDTGSICGGSF